MKRTIVVIAFIFTFMFFLPNAKITSAESGEYIMKTRCASCHGIGKVKSADYNKKGWKKNIKRMMNKNGFGKKLNKTEIKLLIDYLDSL